jgi:hypothetical protein
MLSVNFRAMKLTAICALVAISIGCASGGTKEKQTTGPGMGTGSVPQGAPLGFIVGRSVLVLPVQRNVIFPDSTWKSEIATGSTFTAALDDAIESSLTQRGVSAGWTFAAAISATARRNTGMVPDPHVLAIGNLTRLTKAGDDPLPQALGSQIRELVALRDGRYAVLPAAVRFSRLGTAERAALVLYLIDSRTARIVWSGEVVSDPSPTVSPAMAASLAEHIADLVVGK